MMIKAIIFDAGGVYVEGDYIDFINDVYRFLGINKRYDEKLGVTFDAALNRGEITVEECFRKYFKIPINDKQMKKIVEIWTSTWKPTQKMIKFVASLKKHYKLAILSNSDPANTEKYEKKGWNEPFDVIVLSHEIGIIKPDKRIYEICLEKLRLKAEECVFIDDQERCLETAEEMGMRTILFASLDQLKEDLKKLGVEA